MFDLGRPLHVYDAAKLSGGLVARKARPGEQVLALNGKTYALDRVDDGHRRFRARSTISAASWAARIRACRPKPPTSSIECAYFDPDGIARTGQKLLLTSDARSRFERGVDPAFLADGLAIATRLVLDLCGGTPSEPADACGHAADDAQAHRL